MSINRGKYDEYMQATLQNWNQSNAIQQNMSNNAQQSQNMQNIFSAANGQSISQRGYPYPVTKASRIANLQSEITKLNIELEKLTLDDPHTGPTNRELMKYESLNNAWNEYVIIRKLIGDLK